MANINDGTLLEPMAPVSGLLHLIDALRALALYGVITFNILVVVAALVGRTLFPKAGRRSAPGCCSI